MNSNLNTANVQKDITLEIKKKALICGINLGDDELFYYQLKELKSLCEACNLEVIETITQNLKSVNPATYVGIGKLKEIYEIASATEIDTIVFNDELSPSQLKNIDDVLGNEFEVIDRTMAILEIFEKRATSKEAYLQVEIAKLKYMLPRLIGTRGYLSRTGGGGGGGAGARRGLGETKLELDRRHIEMKISKAKQELEALKKARQTSRKMRNDNGEKTVAFVGYTNAGKSSTINAILKLFGSDSKEVFVKDMLFATLETQTRKVKLPNNHSFLITDTVGFVSKLPHHLVESFKSTLEEIKEANLIIHIIDANSPFRDLQIQTTNEVLESLGVQEIPTIYVLNKTDLVKNMITLNQYQNSIHISAKLNEGVRDLVNKIDETLYNETYLDKYLIPYDQGSYVSLLQENCHVIETNYLNEGIEITASVSLHIHNLLSKYKIN